MTDLSGKTALVTGFARYRTRERACHNFNANAWRQAIDDAGRFLDQWGNLADSFGWLRGDLFDVPRDGAMGLVWCSRAGL